MRKNALSLLLSLLIFFDLIVFVAGLSIVNPKTSPGFFVSESEHDIKIILEAPANILLGYSSPLKATAVNVGSSAETNVTLCLFIDGAVVASKSADLAVGSNSSVSYTWVPGLTLEQVELPRWINDVSFSYNITAYAYPVEGETNIADNVETKIVNVWNPVLYVESPPPKNVGETFTISVKVANLTDKMIPHPDPARAAIGSKANLGNLYGLDIEFSWDPNILEYVSHTPTIPIETYPGGVLHAPLLEPWINNTVYASDGFYRITVSSLSPAPVFNNPYGSNTVFNMTFRVKSKGGCLLKLRFSDLSRKWELGQDLLIFHARLDGAFETVGAPKAVFTCWPPDAAVANKTVHFDASGSYDPDGSINLYIWDFGDGSKQNTTDPVVSHNYTKEGLYSITLRVRDNEGSLSVPVIKRLWVVKKRDIKLETIGVSSKLLLQNLTLTISVKIKNYGDWAESFMVSVYYNKTAVDTDTLWEPISVQSVVKMAELSELTLKFYWNTSGVTPEAYYYIMANATELPHEERVNDNVLLSSEAVFITAEIRHDVAVVDIDIKASVGTTEFNLPVLRGENVTVHLTVASVGNVPETCDVTLHVIAPNGTLLLSKTWEALNLDPGDTLRLTYIFSSADLLGGNYTASVSAVIQEEDYNPDDNSMDEIFRIITPPTLVFEVPSEIHVGDTITFDASASEFPDGEIAVFEWTFYQGGLLKWIKRGESVDVTFDSIGPWKVRLEVWDNYGITYQAGRPQTRAYRKEVIFDVTGKTGGFTPEMLYLIIGTVVVVVVGVFAYLRLRKPREKPES
ncbi:MAG: PKD domain-containing protein [Candidatus Bathyarchaeia archaeon]